MVNKNIKWIFILMLSLTLALSGCKKAEDNGKNNNVNDANPDDSDELEVVKETSKNLELYNVELVKNSNYQVDIIEFDLGKKEYISNAGKTMPYNIKGIMGVPKGEGEFPLILITHGSHSNDDESLRFDTGFDYLVHELAESGYIVVSMDMSKPYIWKYGDNDEDEKSIPLAKDHIINLIKGNEGKDPGYGVDLHNKIDFEKVGLIGHSRGGEIIYKIATDLREDKDIKGVKFKSILSLAPTYFFDREWPDCDTAIIVPEFDGDVMSLDGLSIYNTINENTKGFNRVTLLKKANHNYFNRNIERNDALMIRSEEELEEQLTREEHEEFLVSYSIDFFNSSLLESDDSFFGSNDKTQPNKMYGYDVTTMYRNQSAIELVDITSLNDFTAEGSTIENKIDSWFYKHDEILIDTVTAGDGSYMKRPLVHIQWESNDSKVVITPKIQDFSKYTSLNFDLVMDTADELNVKDGPGQFTIALKDEKGNIAKVTLPENLNALGYTPGEVQFTDLEDFKIYYWSKPSPLAGISISLDEFASVNLEKIESIILIFDKASSGGLYIDSVYVQ